MTPPFSTTLILNFELEFIFLSLFWINFANSPYNTEGLVIYETDKTGKFVVDELENVENKMEKHFQNDKVIGPEAVKRAENKINSQTSSWIEILSIGEAAKHKRRTKMNLVAVENPIPILKGTAKDHKPAENSIIGPEMRPIMGAKAGPNTGLSQIGCSLLRK